MSTDQIIQIVIGVLGFFLVGLLSRIDRSLDRLTDSVEVLNKNVAVIVERVDSHEKRIDKLENL